VAILHRCDILLILLLRFRHIALISNLHLVALDLCGSS
jgi:hypothetical protein